MRPLRRYEPLLQMRTILSNTVHTPSSFSRASTLVSLEIRGTCAGQVDGSHRLAKHLGQDDLPGACPEAEV